MSDNCLRMPAEWERHRGTWLAFPHNESHWPDNFQPIPKVYAEIIRALATSEPVFLTVNDLNMEREARHVLHEAALNEQLLKQVFFCHIPTDASWIRDSGPIFVFDQGGKPLATDWIFNAWGNKYTPYDKDNSVPKACALRNNVPLIETGIVLEGGSIDVNGRGLLLTTEQCLLNKNRNPSLTKEEIESALHRYLGASKVLWLKEGIIGDDTDGHVDDIARFVNPNTVVTTLEENERDENFAPLQENWALLQQMTDLHGNALKLVALPMPDPVFFQGQRLPASYANFYIANEVVIVPTFRCPKKDEKALSLLRPLFPSRRVVGIDSVDLVLGLGTLHCSTKEQPYF